MKCGIPMLSNFIEEYEELLIGERKEFSQYFFEDNICTEDLVLECIRYACEKLLKWTPKQACALFNARIVDMMKMRMMINYIEFPLELEKEKDYYYVIHKLYPDIMPFSVEDSVINMYKRILNGKVQFPREYASGPEGITKICICLQYAIEHYHPFHSVKEMYVFFTSMDGTRFMKKYQIFSIMTLLGMDPLTLLHETLPEDQKSDFYFYYYSFWKKYRKRCRLLNKGKNL